MNFKKILSGIIGAFIIFTALPADAVVHGSVIQFLLSQVRTSTGALVGGKVYFYNPGTTDTTGVQIWLDEGATSAANNPYTLDANATAQLYASGKYHIVIKDAAGVTRYDRDNVSFFNFDQAYEYDALQYGAGTCTKATLDTAYAAVYTAIGSGNWGTLLLRPCSWVMNANADYSAYADRIVTKATPGAVFTHSTYTLNIPNLNAGLYRVFNGTGAVTLSGKTSEVYPDWWKNNITPGTTDMLAAVQSAINSLASGGQVFIPGYVYALSDPLSLASNITISGTGKASELRYTSISTNHFIVADNLQNVLIEKLYINGNATARSSVLGSSVSISNSDDTFYPRENNITLRNCYISGAGFVNVSVLNAHNVIVEDNFIFDGYDTGIAVNYGSSKVLVKGNYIEDNLFGISFSSQGITAPQLAIVGYVRDSIATNNIIDVRAGSYGIEFDGIKNCDFSHNQINLTAGTYGIRGIGLWLTGGSDKTEDNTRIIGNGIHFTTSVSGSGIELYLTGESKILVDSNSIISDVSNAAIGILGLQSQFKATNNDITNLAVGVEFDTDNVSYSYLLNENIFDTCTTGIYGIGEYANKSNVYIRDNQFIANTYAFSFVNGYDVYFEGPRVTSAYLTPNSWRSDDQLFYDAVPTTGTWIVGDRIWNVLVGSGLPVGWVCTVAGTPGTWVAITSLP